MTEYDLEPTPGWILTKLSRNSSSRVVIYRQGRQCKAEETILGDFAASDKRRREWLAEKLGVRNNSQNIHDGNGNLHSNGHFSFWRQICRKAFWRSRCDCPFPFRIFVQNINQYLFGLPSHFILIHRRFFFLYESLLQLILEGNTIRSSRRDIDAGKDFLASDWFRYLWTSIEHTSI